MTPTTEERGLAVAHMLMDRQGIVTRDGVLAEAIPGGFSGLYPVFSSLEDIGLTRRGYFIEGLGGAQFGIPGAIDRLRMSTDDDLIVMACTDPANPYGATLTWPSSEGSPQRRARSSLAMAAGTPVAWLDPGGRTIALFDADETLAVEAIWMLAIAHPRSVIGRIDSVDSRDHPLGRLLTERGFVPGYKGFAVPRSAPASRQPTVRHQ